MAKREKGLPKRIYVALVKDDGPWLNAEETPDAFDDGVVVGIYELVETKTMSVAKTLK